MYVLEFSIRSLGVQKYPLKNNYQKNQTICKGGRGQTYLYAPKGHFLVLKQEKNYFHELRSILRGNIV